MTIDDQSSRLRKRFAAIASDHFDALEHDLTFESGSVADYHALAGFHYRSHHPGVVSAVFRVVHEQPTVVGRYLQRRNDRIVVGVLVRSLPRLSCRLRDLALCNRYSTLPASDAALLVNRELRIISRVVIDPRWRGRGLGIGAPQARHEWEPSTDSSWRLPTPWRRVDGAGRGSSMTG